MDRNLTIAPIRWIRGPDSVYYGLSSICGIGGTDYRLQTLLKSHFSSPWKTPKMTNNLKKMINDESNSVGICCRRAKGDGVPLRIGIPTGGNVFLEPATSHHAVRCQQLLCFGKITFAIGSYLLLNLRTIIIGFLCRYHYILWVSLYLYGTNLKY